MYGKSRTLRRLAQDHDEFAEHLEYLRRHYPRRGFSVVHYNMAVREIFMISAEREASVESMAAIQDHKLRALLLMKRAGLSAGRSFPLLANKKNRMFREMQKAEMIAYLHIAHTGIENLRKEAEIDTEWYARPNYLERMNAIQLFLNAVDTQYLNPNKGRFLTGIQRQVDYLMLAATSRLTLDFEASAADRDPADRKRMLQLLADFQFAVDQIEQDIVEKFSLKHDSRPRVRYDVG